MKKNEALKSVSEHGTPLMIVDHNIIRENYKLFKKHLPRIQAYFAVKANPEPAIVKTLFNMGASFDVASIHEFMLVHELIKEMPEQKRHHFIYDKIIYANTIKSIESLKTLRPYKPLLTYDNIDEIKKIKQYCDTAGVVLRIKVPDTGSMVELNSKFGVLPNEATGLIEAAWKEGLVVEGLSFHVGSQCTNFDNYVKALNIVAELIREAEQKGYKIRIVDIGGGFPAPYDENVPRFEKLAKLLNFEIDRLFPKNIDIIAEPGRFFVATAATLVTQIIGRARRSGKMFYHINDGVYHTFSGCIFDHCTYHFDSFKNGKKEVCAVVGPTCDGFDKVSMAENLPGDLQIGDYLYSLNIGAYTNASATYFNGFPPAKIVHINQ
ncbi:type III PLP-dependent enzyme [Candidatus Woesearchaeota archaeon]|nr:type III PLP-dependent enzyme [Candidatus Woesearchaeota archaeon]